MDEAFPFDEVVSRINRARDDTKILWQAFEENEADDLVKEIVSSEDRAACLITQLVSCLHNLYEAGNEEGRAYILALLHPIDGIEE